MVLKVHIKNVIIAIVSVVLVLVFSCDKPAVINCSDCETEEPLTTRLELSMQKGYNATVSIYEGNLEDSILYVSVFSEDDHLYQKVPLNRKYTITATYYDRGNRYVVVNSVTPRVLYDEYSCEEPCYFVYDRKVNLKLKYKKYGSR